MYPGLTDADCQIAEFRFREARAEAQRWRLALAERPVPTSAETAPQAIRRLVGTLLVRLGHRLSGTHRTDPADAPLAPPSHLPSAAWERLAPPGRPT